MFKCNAISFRDVQHSWKRFEVVNKSIRDIIADKPVVYYSRQEVWNSYKFPFLQCKSLSPVLLSSSSSSGIQLSIVNVVLVALLSMVSIVSYYQNEFQFNQFIFAYETNFYVSSRKCIIPNYKKYGNYIYQIFFSHEWNLK